MKSVLTGNTRFRAETRWFKPPLVVLQLEMRGNHPDHDVYHLWAEECTWWVDAEPQQVMPSSLVLVV